MNSSTDDYSSSTESRTSVESPPPITTAPPNTPAMSPPHAGSAADGDDHAEGSAHPTSAHSLFARTRPMAEHMEKIAECQAMAEERGSTFVPFGKENRYLQDGEDSRLSSQSPPFYDNMPNMEGVVAEEGRVSFEGKGVGEGEEDGGGRSTAPIDIKHGAKAMGDERMAAGGGGSHGDLPSNTHEGGKMDDEDEASRMDLDG